MNEVCSALFKTELNSRKLLGFVVWGWVFFLVGVHLMCKIILFLGSQVPDFGLICRNEEYSTDFGIF